MAAVLTPLLFLLILATATTTQCHHAHKHHGHAAKVSFVTPPATVSTICHRTPHPSSCLLASSSTHHGAIAAAQLAASSSPSSITALPADILSVALASLSGALSAVSSLSPALASTLSSSSQLRLGAAQDCLELHAATLRSLSRCASLLPLLDGHGQLPAVRAHLSAALTNKATCLDGLGNGLGAGSSMDALLDQAYAHVSNSLSLLARPGHGGFSATVANIILHHNRRLLQDDNDDDDEDTDDGSGSGSGDSAAKTITVAKDGTGDFRTVGEAVAAAPNNSEARTVIRVRAGTYEENVEVPACKTNVALVGDGRDVTVITGSRSAADGWTTFRSATVGVSGEGFLARDIAFRNTAGAAKGQAVALRVNADHAAVYRCAVEGHQDALYAHSFRQFYRESTVSGTVDLVFGNAAAVLQACALVGRAPVPGQSNVLTAQARSSPDEDTGFAVHNCTVAAAPGVVGTQTFLGRPWGAYARAVVMESYLGPLVDRAGWAGWPGAEPARGDTVYFGEYGNRGPGAGTDGRVGWAGFHEMGYDEAAQFSVDSFIYGDDWLGATSFPYDDGLST